MASQQEEEEAAPLVGGGAAGGGVELDEGVKKGESRRGEFSVNGAPVNRSFNSRISTDVEMAESQVAVAGSVDSAPEVSAVGTGVEEPSAARVDHHAGPASSGEVVDATEKVESWDLSEAVQEGAAGKEDSKPKFSEDGTGEESRSSDLVADAPTSAASVEDSGAADVEREKTGEGRSDEEDVGVGREVVLPAEGGVTEDGSPKVEDEGSVEKGDREGPEAPVEEVHKVGEATTSAGPEKEGASAEVVPSPSADVEEKAVALEDKPVDVADKFFEVKSEDAGLVREDLPAGDAASEEVTPKILDQGSTGKGDSEAPESPVEEKNEIAKATIASEPDEAVGSLEAVPSLSAYVEDKSVNVEDKAVDVEDKAVDAEDKAVDAEDKAVDAEDKAVDAEDKPVDVEDKSVDVEDKPVDVEDKPVDVEDKPVDVEDKPSDAADKSLDVGVQNVEMNSEDAGVASEELPAVVAASEEVSPKDEVSAEKGNIEAPEAPVEEVQEVAEVTRRAESDELEGLKALPSSPVDAEQNSADLNSSDAVAVSEDVSPITKDEESAEKVDSEATEAPVEGEVHEVAEATSGAEPDEAGSNVHAVRSPSVDFEEKSVELDSAGAGAISEDVSPKIKDEESAEKVDSEAPEVSVKEVQEVAEPTTSAESAEEAASLEAVPSPPVDVEDQSVEMHSEDAGAVSEDVSPKIQDEEKVVSEAPDAPVEDKVREVAETTTTAEPDEVVADLEAAPLSSVSVEEKSVELDSSEAGAVSEDVSPKIDAEESAEKFDSNAPEPLVEEVHEVTPDTKPDEAGSKVEAVPSPSVGVEEKSFEPGSAGTGAMSEYVSPEIKDEESAEKVDSNAPEPLVEEVHEVTPDTKPDEAGSNVEALPSPYEEKSVEPDSAGAGAMSEYVSPKIKDEESVDNDDIEARETPVGEQEVAEARTSTEPDEANVEAVPSPSVDVEEKSFNLNSVDAGAVSEGVSPEIEAEGSAEKVDREAPEVPMKDAVHERAEATSRAEPDEAVSSVEAVSVPSADVEDKSSELNSADAGTVSEDVSPLIKDEESTEKVDSEAHEPYEIAEAINGAEPAEEVSSSFSVPSPSVDVEEKSSELDHVDPTINTEAHGETVSQESVSVPAVNVEDKSVQEADPKDTSEATEVLPPETTTDKEDISPEPLPEGRFKSETLFFPDEEVHEVVEETISAEPREVPLEPESALAPSDVEDRSVDVNSGDAIGVTTTSEGVDKEGVGPETSSEATISAGADASMESEGSASLESLSVPANNVEDRSLGVNSEDTSEAKIESDTENTNKEGLSPELPAEGSADNVGSESLFTSPEEVHEVIEETISPELDEGPTSLESGPASDNIEEKPEDLNEATTTVQPVESVDKELVNRDLPVDELHASVEEIGKFEGAATDEEPIILESAVASSEDVQSVPETKSREFNFNDLKESLTTSEKEETAIGEEGNSSDAVARDTTPLDVSSPPPAGEKKKSRKSYDLHEEAVHLEEAAEKTLEDVKAGDKHAPVAESVAQIVLDESSKTEDSSELISGVIQHVGQFAQDGFQSDPNVLPDTVNQVFDRQSEGSPANEGSQPKESSSLGTKFSLFVIWCISLCASHVSSKDMPAPALKLGAEEVAAVLHSNSQGAASSKAASSV